MQPTARAYLEAHQQHYLSELMDLLRIPSISTLPQHRPDLDRAAAFVAGKLTHAGLENVEIIATSGHPLVYGDWLHAPGAPTILCYGHYDVQPPEPLEEWITPPFEPTLRDGNLYARGAADDKGQFYTHVKAVETMMQTTGRLPVNVRFLIEGEEEVGGEAIEKYVREHPERLRCDVALVSDTSMFAPTVPSIDTGLRGMVYTEIEVRGAGRDLHSGLYGGVAPNPFEALVRILNGLKSPEGRILVPGFYDDVEPPAAEEMASWQRLPFDEEAYRRDEVRASALTGETGYSVFERTWARPTLDIHGMPGGFTGAGSKTVIPARASAKVSMRLVPRQNPQKIADRFRSAVEALTPRGYDVSVKIHSLADPILIEPSNPYLQAGVAALREVFSADPVFVRSGGSIPIVALFACVLQAPSVMMGFGLPDDGLHSPNEKLRVANFYDGIRAVITFFERLGK